VVPFISQIATSPDGGVAPQNVGLAVAVEVALTAIDQVLGDTVATYEEDELRIAVPFISQIATLPDVSRHNMSLLPSALKS
jgi:hypothetical protein